ncbi:MAG: AI-2E family transporter [Pseudomonadota bacterium]
MPNVRHATMPLTIRIAAGLLIGSLAFFVFMILQPFIIPIAWAVILSCVTWPLYTKVLRLLKGRASMSACIMVIGFSIAFVLPILWLIIVIQDDVSALYLSIPKYVNQGLRVPESIRGIPWLGNFLQAWLDNHIGDMSTVRKQAELWMAQSSQQLLKIVGGVGSNVGRLGVTLITLFFLYRDGEKFLAECMMLLKKIIGERATIYLKKANDMTQAVVYSMAVTGVSQGIMGAIGYWLLSAPAPILFGVLTAVASMVPLFGTFLVWGMLSLWLLLAGHQMQALGLLVWGIVLINPIDNIMRPLVMSNMSQVSFLLTLFGALGGLAAFGMVGLFVGPVVLALAATIWKEWLLNPTSFE